MKKLKMSLTMKITLLCVGLVLVFSLAMRFYAYKTAETAVEDTMGQNAMNIINSVNKIIDVEKFKQLQTAEDMESEYFNQLREELDEMRTYTGLKYLYTMRKAENGDYIYVVDGSSLEEVAQIGEVEEEMSDVMLACLEGKEGYEYDISEEWGPLISGYVPIIDSTGAVVGLLGADFEAGYLAERLEDANTSMYLFLFVILLISIVMATLFSSYIVHSLKRLKKKIKLIEQGDLTVKVESNTGDEVGSLSHTFQTMLNNMTQIIKHIRDNTDEVINKVTSLDNSIDISNCSTEEISNVINEVTAGAVEQVENSNIVARSMENVFTEITAIMSNIDMVNSDSDTAMKDMQEASEILKNSVKQINLVNDTVDNTAVMMKKLEEKFKEVLHFSGIVSNIASKTNLLALNASIEAASAGEHGKGFAVVAGEIKNLAIQSNDASKRINELISAVQTEISNSSGAIESGVIQARNGVDVISKVEVYLDKLSSSNQKVDIRIKDIAKAITSIERDSNMVLEKTQKLSDISKEFSAGTQHTADLTDEQVIIMENIRKILYEVKEKMEQLGINVNMFTIE